jgi:hypothetical protein
MKSTRSLMIRYNSWTMDTKMMPTNWSVSEDTRLELNGWSKSPLRRCNHGTWCLWQLQTPTLTGCWFVPYDIWHWPKSTSGLQNLAGYRETNSMLLTPPKSQLHSWREERGSNLSVNCKWTDKEYWPSSYPYYKNDKCNTLHLHARWKESSFIFIISAPWQGIKRKLRCKRQVTRSWPNLIQ